MFVKILVAIKINFNVYVYGSGVLMFMYHIFSSFNSAQYYFCIWISIEPTVIFDSSKKNVLV